MAIVVCVCVSGLFYAHTTQRQAAEIADAAVPEPWDTQPLPCMSNQESAAAGSAAPAEEASAAAAAEAKVNSALARYSAAKGWSNSATPSGKPPHAHPKASICNAPSASICNAPSLAMPSQVDGMQVEVDFFVTIRLCATAVSTASEVSFPCVTNGIGRWRCRPPVLHSCFYSVNENQSPDSTQTVAVLCEESSPRPPADSQVSRSRQ